MGQEHCLGQKIKRIKQNCHEFKSFQLTSLHNGNEKTSGREKSSR